MLAVANLPDFSMLDNTSLSRPAFVASYTESPNAHGDKLNWRRQNLRNNGTIGAGVFSPGVEYWNAGGVTLTLNWAADDFVDAQVKMLEMRRMALSSHWQSMVFDPEAPTDVDTISATIECIFECMSLFGASSIDLSNVGTMHVNGEHLAAVLRVTFHVKCKVRGWDKACNAAKEALLAANQDPQDALFGLI